MSSLTINERPLDLQPYLENPNLENPNLANPKKDEFTIKLQNLIIKTIETLNDRHPEENWPFYSIVELMMPDGPLAKDFPSIMASAYNITSYMLIKGSFGVLGSAFQFLSSCSWLKRFSINTQDVAAFSKKFHYIKQEIRILEQLPLCPEERERLFSLKMIVEQGHHLLLKNNGPTIVEAAMSITFSSINTVASLGLLINSINSYVLPNWSMSDYKASCIPLFVGTVGVTANLVHCIWKQKHPKIDLSELIKSAEELHKNI